EARPGEVVVDARADLRQRGGEREHLLVLRRVADRAPAGVVAVLLSPLGVAADRLDVTVGVEADPDERPRRRHREPADAGENLLIGDWAAVGKDVVEALAGAATANAGLMVAHVAQPGHASDRRRRNVDELLDRHQRETLHPG